MPEALHELDALTADWRQVPTHVRSDAASLRALVERQRRRMVAWLVADIAVSALAIAAALAMVVQAPGTASTLFAADVLVMLAAAWAFATWTRRGTWQPIGESAETYLALARLRCRRQLQALHLGLVLLVAQLVIVATWVAWGPGVRIPGWTPSPGLRLLLPALVVLGFTGALVWARRRTRRELAELDALAAAMRET